MDTYDILTNRVMYSVGETIVVIGLFITIVGLVTMIYSYPFTKELVLQDNLV